MLTAYHDRFKHPVSQVAAGIVLACYMQGICACKFILCPHFGFLLIYATIHVDGYDPLVNDDR